MSIYSIQSYYFSILNHDIPYESISKPDKYKGHKKKKRKEYHVCKKKNTKKPIPSFYIYLCVNLILSFSFLKEEKRKYCIYTLSLNK